MLGILVVCFPYMRMTIILKRFNTKRDRHNESESKTI